jgi:hypothetical protein
MDSIAPIILFAYNRPEHTRKTLRSLQANYLADQSALYIYVDGAKQDATEEHKSKVKKVKEVIREEKWCKDVFIIESDVNKGLALSVMKGVTEIVNRYGSVIVLEDDLVSDKWFLKFMNESLHIYEPEKQVACISGYIYPVKEILPETFFLKGADCWGWATWKRGWEILERDGSKLLKELEEKQLTSDFDFNDSYPYVQMLKDQISGKNNSWAILWYASAYLKNKYCLYPGYSLIQNIGIDGSGIHSGTTTKFDVKLLNKEVKVEKIEIKEEQRNREIVSEYFSQLKAIGNESFLKKLIRKIVG